jgi:uncharacterized membrane protein YfbV (UPF0208 family)
MADETHFEDNIKPTETLRQYKVLLEHTPTSEELEQYKLYVHMADKVSERRIQANTFYITLLTGLFALLSIVVERGLLSDVQAYLFTAVGMLGILLCFIWFINIRSYRQLNTGKFKVIHEMEQHLPFPCYAREWEILKKGRERKTYFPLSHVEQYIPVLFSLPYLFLVLVSIHALTG